MSVICLFGPISTKNNLQFSHSSKCCCLDAHYLFSFFWQWLFLVSYYFLLCFLHHAASGVFMPLNEAVRGKMLLFSEIRRLFPFPLPSFCCFSLFFFFCKGAMEQSPDRAATPLITKKINKMKREHLLEYDPSAEWIPPGWPWLSSSALLIFLFASTRRSVWIPAATPPPAPWRATPPVHTGSVARTVR